MRNNRNSRQFEVKMFFKLNVILGLVLFGFTCKNNAFAFIVRPITTPNTKPSLTSIFFDTRSLYARPKNIPMALFSSNSNETNQKETLPLTSPNDNNDINLSSSTAAAAIGSLPPSDNMDTSRVTPTPEASSATFMITNEMKRILIEELGYKRTEATNMRVELVASVIEQRIFRPSDGMPTSWYIPEDDPSRKMMEKLQNESKYPLKVPLLAMSLILTGKGISDAIITIIKVNMGINGASLSEQFMGIPVMGIDFICTVSGIALGFWTFKNMQD